jgi:hypothetical protein
MNHITITRSKNYLQEKDKIREYNKEFHLKLEKLENELNELSYRAATDILINTYGGKDAFIRDDFWHFKIGDFRILYRKKSDLKKIQLLTIYSASSRFHKDLNLLLYKFNNIESIIEYEIEKVIIEDKEETIIKPVLSPLQIKIKNMTAPIIVMGAAGSGKTITAIEIYKDLVINGIKEDRIAYVTLSKNLKNHAKDELKLSNFKALNLYDFVDFANIKYSGKDLIDDYRNKIKTIVNQVKNDYKVKDFKKFREVYDDYYIISVLRGFYQGRLDSKNNYEPYKNDISVFNDLCRHEEFDNESIEIKILKQVMEIYKKGNFIDDHSFESLKRPAKKFDYIIVDEVQDLTEVQINYITNRLNNYPNLFLFGHVAQTINPNFFEATRLQGLIDFKCNDEKSPSIENLIGTFRSGESLVMYLNHILKIKQKYIGRLKVEDEEEELSLNKNLESNWACYIDDEKLFLEVYDKCIEESSDCAIIVDSEENKKDLEKRYSKLPRFDIEKIFTIYEIKGLEHQHIVLYNFLSSNQKYLELMFEKHNKTNSNKTIYRRIINRFYVGLTRAKKSIILIEYDLSENIKSNFLNYQDRNSKLEITLIDETNAFELDEYLEIKYINPLTLKDSGQKYKDNGFFKQAIDKFEKALIIMKKDDDYYDEDLFIDIEKLKSTSEKLRDLEFSLENNNLDLAISTIEDLVMINELDAAINGYKRIGVENANLDLLEYLNNQKIVLNEFTKMVLDSNFKNDIIYKKILEERFLKETIENFNKGVL